MAVPIEIKNCRYQKSFRRYPLFQEFLFLKKHNIFTVTASRSRQGPIFLSTVLCLIFDLVCIVLGARAAYNGERYRYPLCIRLIT